MIMIDGKDYTEVVEESRFAGIHVLFISIYLTTTDIEDEVESIKYSELKLIKLLRELAKSKEIRLTIYGYTKNFRKYVEDSDLEKELKKLQDSFPKEYDKKTIEDMKYLWWFRDCHLAIGWRQDDGDYYYD